MKLLAALAEITDAIPGFAKANSTGVPELQKQLPGSSLCECRENNLNANRV